MERHSFLSSLPFLISTRSPAWPPVSGSGADAGSCASSILLGDSYDSQTYVVSFELLSSQKNEPINRHNDCGIGIHNNATGSTRSRPLFFYSKTEAKHSNSIANCFSGTGSSSDPSLADIQIAVVKHTNDMTSSVYLRIDQIVYSVDLTQQTKMEVLPEAYANDLDPDDDHSTRMYRKVLRPCSFVLEFDNILMRVFRNVLDVCREDTDNLTAVCLTLSTLESIAFRDNADDAGSTTPSTDSAVGSSGSTTVDDAGQAKQGQRDDKSREMSPTKKSSPSLRNGKKRPIESHVVVQAQHHRDKMIEAVTGFAKIRHVLDVPVSVLSMSDTISGSDLDLLTTSASLSFLMNKTAQAMSQSFVSVATLTSADEYYGSLLHQNHSEMEDSLMSFFPAPNRAGRNRRTSNHAIDSAVKEQPIAITESTVDDFALILQKHKTLVKERQNLLFLPTRG